MEKRKKYMLILLIVFVVLITLIVIGLLFTGDDLVCKSSGTSNGIKITQEYTIKASKNEVNKVTIKKEYKFNDKEKYKSFDMIIDSTSKYYNNIDKKNVKYSDTTMNKKYSYTLKVNVKELSKKKLKELGLSKSLKTLKKNIKTQGLKCE